MSLWKLEQKRGTSHEPEPDSSPRRVDLLRKQIGCCPELKKQVSCIFTFVYVQSMSLKNFETRNMHVCMKRLHGSLFRRYMEMSMAPQQRLCARKFLSCIALPLHTKNRACKCSVFRSLISSHDIHERHLVCLLCDINAHSILLM